VDRRRSAAPRDVGVLVTGTVTSLTPDRYWFQGQPGRDLGSRLDNCGYLSDTRTTRREWQHCPAAPWALDNRTSAGLCFTISRGHAVSNCVGFHPHTVGPQPTLTEVNELSCRSHAYRPCLEVARLRGRQAADSSALGRKADSGVKILRRCRRGVHEAATPLRDRR